MSVMLRESPSSLTDPDADASGDRAPHLAHALPVGIRARIGDEDPSGSNTAMPLAGSERGGISRSVVTALSDGFMWERGIREVDVNKPRVTLIAPQPYGENRGTPMANRRLAHVLADGGHAVDVITLPFGPAHDYPGVTVHRCRRMPGVKSVGIGFSLSKLLMDASLAWSAWRLIRRSGTDCIQAVEEAAFFAVILGKLTRTPVVYDMDSVMSHEIAMSSLGRIPGMVLLARLLERWAIRNSAFVMTICEPMAEYVRQVDPSKRVVAIPDLPLMPPPGGPDPSRVQAQLPPDLLHGRKIVMYTGSLASYQGMDLLISAMPLVVGRHPNALLLVVGGDEESIARLDTMASNLGLTSSVRFLGKKPSVQIPDLLALADVLVSPRRTGMNPPGKIYTYMQSGRPIVATSIPAHTSVITDDSAVMVETSPESIADGICWALDHPDQALERASRAREAISYLTPEYQAQLILKSYENLGTRDFV